jgi:plasmid maintenance system antidote protein VapI
LEIAPIIRFANECHYRPPKSALTPEMALRIEKAFGPDMDHLLRMQLAYDVAQVRRRGGRISVKRYVAA